MADPNMTTNNSNNSNQTMQREQAKAEVGGSSDRQREQSGMDKDRKDKSAIGGQSKSAEKSDEVSKDKSQSDFGKSRNSEPTGQR